MWYVIKIPAETVFQHNNGTRAGENTAAKVHSVSPKSVSFGKQKEGSSFIPLKHRNRLSEVCEIIPSNNSVCILWAN